MYRLTIEGQTHTFDTLDAMVTHLKDTYADPLAHGFGVEKQVDGEWVGNPDPFKLT